MSKKDNKESETEELAPTLEDFDWEDDEPKISRENAIKTLKPFLKRCGVNPGKITDKTKKENIVKFINNVCDGIMRGDLELEEIEGEYQITQHIQHRKLGSTIGKIVFGEYYGKDHKEMDDDLGHVASALAIMASVCKSQDGAIIIDGMRSSDLDLLESLSMLFL